MKINFHQTKFRHQMGEKFLLSHLESSLTLAEFSLEFSPQKKGTLEETHDDLMAAMQKNNERKTHFSCWIGRSIRHADARAADCFLLALRDDRSISIRFNYFINEQSPCNFLKQKIENLITNSSG